MANDVSTYKLAFQTTLHCTMGCGIGEVVGVVIGIALGLAAWLSLTIGVILGFVFGFLLGMRPLVKRGQSIKESFKIIFATELVSIVVMEAAQVFIEINTGIMSLGLFSPIFWGGMLLALVGGFAAAYPVNYFLVKRGVRHVH